MRSLTPEALVKSRFVPVQVISCEAPFLIYRLHQIDFRRWRESEVLAATDANALIADYALCHLQEGALQRLERALSRSAHILAQDSGQLPSQLFGRLMSTRSPELRGMLDKARSVARQPWLRPLTASLAAERSNRWLRPE